MPEKQVLFRLSGSLLNKLDKKLADRGYRTRNSWFQDTVEKYVGEKRKAPAKAPARKPTKKSAKKAPKRTAKKRARKR